MKHVLKRDLLKQFIPVALIVVVAAVVPMFLSSAKADWVWNTGYLWNGNAPLRLTVVSNADATWTQRLTQSAAQWSNSGVVNVSVGGSGKIALYDGYYGTSRPCAWTQYWQHNGNISHDAIYMNETCLASWTDYWKQYALCQELGHAIGLPDHDTTPTVASCMAPSLSGTAPSTDDFAELTQLYG
jgi:hypothetical protein